MEIRDTRNGSWHWVNNAVIACPHISAYDKVIYSALTTFAGCKEIRPDFGLIAERAGLSESTAKRSIKSLVEVGYVKKVQGGGRGKANVYDLLKVPKGCQRCTLSKGCQPVPKRVSESSIKGVRQTLQVDKEIDKEIDNLATQSVAVSLNEIITLFEKVNPSFERMYSNTTQRQCLERLVKKYGEDKVRGMIKFLPSLIGKQYAPTITTPYQLEQKLGQLVDYVEKEKGKSPIVVKI